jgi:hypothetical protein
VYAQVVVEVVEFAEQLWAACVIAFQDFEISSRTGISVLENPELLRVWLLQGFFMLLGSLFSSEEDATDLVIWELLARLEHNVCCTFGNFFAHFSI